MQEAAAKEQQQLLKAALGKITVCGMAPTWACPPGIQAPLLYKTLHAGKGSSRPHDVMARLLCSTYFGAGYSYELRRAGPAAEASGETGRVACIGGAQAEGLEGAKAHFERTWAHFQEALDQIPEAERGKKLVPVQARSPPCPCLSLSRSGRLCAHSALLQAAGWDHG